MRHLLARPALLFGLGGKRLRHRPRATPEPSDRAFLVALLLGQGLLLGLDDPVDAPAVVPEAERRAGRDVAARREVQKGGVLALGLLEDQIACRTRELVTGTIAASPNFRSN